LNFGGEGVPNNSGGVRNNQKPFLAAYAAL